MVSVQLQTGEVFVKIRQHFNYKNKLSFVLQNLNGEMKEAVSIFFFFNHLDNLSFLSYSPSLTSLQREQKVLLECFKFCGLQNQTVRFWIDPKEAKDS